MASTRPCTLKLALGIFLAVCAQSAFAQNVPPVLDSVGDKTVNENELLTFTATASDSDVPAQNLTFSVSNGPSGATITPAGVFTWTPSDARGGNSYTVDIVVRDDGQGNLSDFETITITVADTNIPPVLDPIGDFTVGEESTLSFTAVANDTDEPDDVLVFSLSGAPAGAGINASNGKFTWNLSAAQTAGDYTFDVVVTDNGAGTLSDSETITVTVVEPQVRIMTLGNSMAAGFPHGDGISYQTYIDANLAIPATYIGDANGDRADSGALIVGGDGRILSKVPVVGQGPVSAVFPQSGVQENFEAIKDSVTEPDYIVLMLGSNDLTQLIAPSSVTSFFTPDVPGDFTSAGVFTFVDGSGSADFDVDSIIDRYESLLDIIAERFPSPEIICLAVPPVDPNGTFGGSGSPFDRAKATLATTIPVYNAAIEAMVNGKGSQFTFLTPGLTLDEVLSDGLHPSTDGYELIGTTVADFINGVNNRPVLGAIGDQTLDELDTLAFTATVTDDDSGDDHTFELTGDVPAGASMTTAGVFTWTPTEEQGPGTYTFNIRVTDDGLGTLSDGERITVTVNEDPAAPVLAAIGNQSINEGVELTFTASATDADLPAETLTFSLSNAPSGAAIDPNTGVFTWTPDGLQGGSDYTFDVVVTDDSASTEADSETITVTVFEFNTPPVLNPVGNKIGDELAEITFTAAATDADLPADTLTFSLAGAPSGASIDPGSGVFTWTPTEAQGPDAYTFDVVVTDDGGGNLTDSETITVTVLEVNTFPVLDAIGNKSVDELVELTFVATGSDVDLPANTLTFGLADQPSGASIEPSTGVFTWTPTEAQGGAVYDFDIIIADGVTGLSLDRETILVTVADLNSAPELDPIGNKTVGELATLRFIATTQDSDEPSDTLTYTLENNPPTGATINGTTGEFRWTLAPGQVAGDYTFDVVVTDDGVGNLSDRETITVTVVEPEIYIMTMGDSLTSGLPHFDGISYQTYLDENLDFPATYVGNPADGLADSGAAIVGGDGSMINRVPAASVFPNDGVQESFDAIKASVTVPNYVVISAGLNDLIQLIAPKDTNDSFVPDTSGDFTTGGTFTDSDGVTSTNHTVPAITDRMESLLDDVAAQFPPSTKIIVLAMSPVDPTGSGDPQFEAAKATLATTVPTYNTKLQALVTSKGSRFAYLDAALGLSDLRSDGVHPTTGGYEKIGITIANFINGNKAPVLAFIADQTVAELVELTFDADATDPEGDDFTFSLVGAEVPAGAAIDEDTGVFTWTPTAAQGPNTYTFSVVVTDTGGASDSQEITVSVTSTDPYDTWIAAKFAPADVNDPGKEATVWGRQANPDGGNWTNEFEFYFGTDPNVVDEPDFVVTDTPTGAKLTFMKNEDAPLDFVDVEYSIDLSTWMTAGLVRQSAGPVTGGFEPVEVIVTAALPFDRVFFQFVGVVAANN